MGAPSISGRSRPRDELDTELFSTYLSARNWSAAAVVLRSVTVGAGDWKRRFVEAIAEEASWVLEQNESTARDGVLRLWLRLAGEFDPQSEHIARVCEQLDARRKE